MYYLSHEPEILFNLICCTAQNFHKLKVQYIRSIQADTVYIKLAHPEADHIREILLHSRVTLIQLYEKIVSAPVFIGKAVSVFVVTPEVHITVPAQVRGVLPVCLQIPEGKEVTAGMVEYTVKDHPDPRLMTGGYEFLQVLVCPQP